MINVSSSAEISLQMSIIPILDDISMMMSKGLWNLKCGCTVLEEWSWYALPYLLLMIHRVPNMNFKDTLVFLCRFWYKNIYPKWKRTQVDLTLHVGSEYKSEFLEFHVKKLKTWENHRTARAGPCQEGELTQSEMARTRNDTWAELWDCPKHMSW